MRFRPGARVRCEMTKWGDRPHWRFAGHWLGEDEHGEWLGFPRGTLNARPGWEFRSDVDCVTLLPRDGWFLATFHAPGAWCDRYVDMTTPHEWHGDVVRAVDLDLDVIRMAPPGAPPGPEGHLSRSMAPGQLFLDDEDEFAEHRVELGYPPEVVAAAEQAAADVLAALGRRTRPFDEDTPAGWLAALRRVTGTGDGTRPPAADRPAGPRGDAPPA